jgi:hypothetical protein
VFKYSISQLPRINRHFKDLCLALSEYRAPRRSLRPASLIEPACREAAPRGDGSPLESGVFAPAASVGTVAERQRIDAPTSATLSA